MVRVGKTDEGETLCIYHYLHHHPHHHQSYHHHHNHDHHNLYLLSSLLALVIRKRPNYLFYLSFFQLGPQLAARICICH